MTRTILTNLDDHARAVYALIIRDLMGRFGRNHLGFVWTILEPMILCVGVMLVWSLIKESEIHGIPLLAFVLTGYMPLTLWRHLTGPLTKLLSKNTGVLYHRPISQIDILFSRAILEFLSSTVAATVIYFVLLSTNMIDPVQRPHLILAGWLLTGWYFGAQGLLISALTEAWEPAEKFIQPSNYLQLPISGAFSMVDWLPGYAQQVLLCNPSIHCFELIRAGFFGEAVTTFYEPSYLVAWCIGMSLLASAAMHHLRHHVKIH